MTLTNTRPGVKRHKTGLLQYLIDGEWKFHICGFGPSSSGEPGWVTMDAQSVDGHYCRVTADITARDVVVFNGFRIPRRQWIH